jgi:Fe-S-cluster-containing dehydrogenase component
MSKISLLFNKKDCMGCHACEIACKQEHQLNIGPRLVRVIEKSPDFYPVYCHHCAHAPCREACPVEAISRNETGMVLIDHELCIGCKDCLPACPFGAMQYDDETDIAVKCDLCVGRLKKGQAPACSTVCPTGCIAWGDIGSISDHLVKEVLPQRMK